MEHYQTESDMIGHCRFESRHLGPHGGDDTRTDTASDTKVPETFAPSPDVPSAVDPLNPYVTPAVPGTASGTAESQV